MTLDEARAANPDLRFNVYAMEPRGPVILELLTIDDGIYTFSALTLEAALAQAFPAAAVVAEEPVVDFFS